MNQVALAFADGAVVAKRNLIKIKRLPEILIWTLMSPIMFVLLFGYVFGGSIGIEGTTYREYLIAGVFAQTVIFGSTFTGAGLAAHGTFGGAGGSHRKRHLLQLDVDPRHVPDRLDRGLADPDVDCRSHRGLPPVAAVRVCVLLDHGVCRIEGAECRGR